MKSSRANLRIPGHGMTTFEGMLGLPVRFMFASQSLVFTGSSFPRNKDVSWKDTHQVTLAGFLDACEVSKRLSAGAA